MWMCSSCGYTLFPARGRESAFFADGFKCPMCGAAKDVRDVPGGRSRLSLRDVAHGVREPQGRDVPLGGRLGVGDVSLRMRRQGHGAQTRWVESSACAERDGTFRRRHNNVQGSSDTRSN